HRTQARIQIGQGPDPSTFGQAPAGKHAYSGERRDQRGDSGMSDKQAGRLAGKIILVTGGASGIGAAAVAACEREGAEVIVADITIADDGPSRRRLDVGNEASWAMLGESIAASHGRL